MRYWTGERQKSHASQRKILWSIPTWNFFPLFTNMFRIICRSCKYFYHFPPHQFLFVCIFASESRQKKHDFSVQVRERKGHSKLPGSSTKQGKYCECHRTRSFSLSVWWAAMGFYFINQLCAFPPCALYIAFDKCFYICDVEVVKSLYIAFLIHKEKFALQVHALRITIKFEFVGTLGGFSLVKSGSFHVLRHKADLVFTTSDKGNQFMLGIFSRSVAHWTKMPFQQECSIRLPVRFHWRNFAFALSARAEIRLDQHCAIFGLIRRGTGMAICCLFSDFLYSCNCSAQTSS